MDKDEYLDAWDEGEGPTDRKSKLLAKQRQQQTDSDAEFSAAFAELEQVKADASTI